MITKIKVDPGFTAGEPTVVTLYLSGQVLEQARELALIVASAPHASTDVDLTGAGYVFGEVLAQEINKLDPASRMV